MPDLRALVNNLRNNSYNLKATEKQELASLIEKVLTEGEQEIKIAAKNELKDDETFKNTVKDELKADKTVIDQVKTGLKAELTEEVKTGLKAELTEEVKTGLKAELTEEVKTDLKADQIIIDQVKANLENEIKQKVDEFDQLKADLETQKAQVLQLTQKNQKLGTEKNELNTKVQKLQKENKELEAKKQPAEQPKPGKAPTYTAVVGVGLAAGLVAFTALDRTVRLDMWIMAGIALAFALAVGGITYFALKPSTQVSETQEPQQVNGKAPKPA